MSNSNNSFNFRGRSQDSESSANSQDQSPRINIVVELNDEELMPSCIEEGMGRDDNSPISCMDVMVTFEEDETEDEQEATVHPLPWLEESEFEEPLPRSGEGSNLRDGNIEVYVEEFDDETDSDSDIFNEEVPPIHGIRFYNPNYQPRSETAQITAINVAGAGDGSGADDNHITVVPNNTQVNNSRLDLRPVPASIDLTRNRHSNAWRAYQARARASTNRLRFQESHNRTVSSNGCQRLCSGQADNQVPIFYDEELGRYVYIRNDTDSEEEPPMPLPAMVPRRGNSVSDLSQCSSDDESAAQQ